MAAVGVAVLVVGLAASALPLREARPGHERAVQAVDDLYAAAAFKKRDGYGAVFGVSAGAEPENEHHSRLL